MAGVSFRNVSKQFGAATAVDAVSLEVADREFLVLVGPSGCGKTTLLRMVAGLEIPSAGEVWIGDRPVNGVPPKDRDVAMVFQSYALYPHMNVFDNVAFGLRTRGVARADVQRRVMNAAELLEIGGLLQRKPRELSGGQRQRVALARAIVREPQVFLMDEPLSNLDAKLRVQTRAELVRLQRRLQATVIYVTHDQTEAMTMADRIVLMNAGSVQQVDTPERVYEWPANTFVAGFAGNPGMNLFPGRVDWTDGAPVLRTAFGSLPVIVVHRRDEGVDREVVAGVRPEHVELLVDGTTTSGAFWAEVDIVEHLGSEKLLNLSVGSGLALIARVAPGVDVHAGQRLLFRVEPTRLRLFDPASGSSIEATPALCSIAVGAASAPVQA